MKFVDEFRDPAAARRYRRRHRRTSPPALDDHGNLRRADPFDRAPRHRPDAARRASPCCTGRAARSASRRRASSMPPSPLPPARASIFCSFGDMLRVPGEQRQPARRQGAGRRCPHGLFAARCAGARARQSRTAQVVFFAIGFETTAPTTRHGRAAGRARRAREFLAAGLACAGAAGDRGAAARSGKRVAGLPRRRPCLHRHGLSGIRTDRARAFASRSSSPASSRSTCCRASICASANSRRAAPRSRISTAARSGAKATRAAQERSAASSPCSRSAGAAWAKSRPAASGSRPAYARFDALRRFRRHRRSRRGQRRRLHQRRDSARPARSRAIARPSATRCTPEHPLGATMVSSEGACAAYYRYRRPRSAGEERGMSESRFDADLPVAGRSQATRIELAHGGGGLHDPAA